MVHHMINYNYYKTIIVLGKYKKYYELMVVHRFFTVTHMIN